MRGIKKIVKPIDVNLPAKAKWVYLGNERGATILIKVGKLSKKQQEILRYTLDKELKRRFSRDLIRGVGFEDHRWAHQREIYIQLWNNHGDVTEEQLFDVIKTTSEIIETALAEVEYEFTLPLPKDTSSWPPKMRT